MSISAEINPSLLLQCPNLQFLQASLDAKSLTISHFSDSQKTETFDMERGPRFKEYSALRERKLRMKSLTEQRTLMKEKAQNRSVLTPQKKQVKFISDFTTPPRRTKIPSVLTQSVPDFSSILRKENRKPAVAERWVTPPMKSRRVSANNGRGCKSTNSGEKRSGGLLAGRKSCVNMEELKRLAVAAGKGINGGKFGNNNK